MLAMGTPANMRECTEIIAGALADPHTPPIVLVAISWNLACALRITPPCTRGFKPFMLTKCRLETRGESAPTPEEGVAAAGFVRAHWQSSAARESGWQDRLVVDVMDGMSTAPLGAAGFCFVCTCCKPGDSAGLFVPAGRQRGGIVKGQKQGHTRLSVHVQNLAAARQEQRQQREAAASASGTALPSNSFASTPAAVGAEAAAVGSVRMRGKRYRGSGEPIADMSIEGWENSRAAQRRRSSHKGVSWSKSSQKWIARIVLNGKEKYLGVYTNELEAAQAYKHALAVDLAEQLTVSQSVCTAVVTEREQLWQQMQEYNGADSAAKYEEERRREEEIRRSHRIAKLAQAQPWLYDRLLALSCQSSTGYIPYGSGSHG